MTGAAPPVVVRPAAPHECGAVADLLDEIWSAGPGSVIPPDFLRALQHTGSCVLVAERSGVLVGASVAYPHGDRPGWWHSHVTGVLASVSGAGVGPALKLAQAEWVRARGGTAVTWTFDPLVRRNAHLNLVVLGAVVVEHVADFYADMADGINAGAGGDRLVVRWDLGPAAATGPARRRVVPSDGLACVLDVAEDGGPSPAAAPPPHDVGCVAALPADVVAMRSAAPDVARRWRGALRAVLDAGRPVLGMDASDRYVLGPVGARGPAH